ncbi:MAG: trigger factor [Terriglobia bacterium]
MEAETCKRELLIQIPYDIVKKESESIAARFARKAHVPGFRPGRVPRDFVLRRFREAIREEVAQQLLPKFFDDAIKEQKLPMVGVPRFEELKFEDEQPLTAKALFEVLPAFELGRYKDLEISEDAAPVTDAEVDQTIERMRADAATFEVVADRAAEDGDVLSVSYTGHDAKGSHSRILEVKDGVVRLGEEGTLPEFTASLRGVRVGDVREFTVVYAEDFPEAKVAGKTVKFRAEILAVKRKVVPPLDDELAKTLSDTATLEEFRASVRKEMEAVRQQKAEAASKRELLDVLGGRQAFPVPEVLVEESVERRMRSVAGHLYDQGIDPRTAGIDWPKMRVDLREEAAKDVRDALILEKVADEEKIAVTQEEIDDAIRGLAAGGNETPAALKTRLTQSGGLARLQSSRRHQKALDALYRSARIVRPSSPADPSSPAGAGK